MGGQSQTDAEIVGRVRRSLTRLTRFTNRLQRTQLACGPVTVQQCHTLEALMGGPLAMKRLADEVALHQSTLTRVVEKLEEKKLVTRCRPPHNQRVVKVELTDAGKDLYIQLDGASNHMIGQILALVPAHERTSVVRGLELLCELLDPQNSAVQELITGCRCNDAVVPPTGEESEVGR